MPSLIKPLLINQGELETFLELEAVATQFGYLLQAKVRLEDVVSLSSLSLSEDEVRFARETHIDFVLANRATSLPLFAIEFDEASHFRTACSRRKTSLKNRIFREAELPFFRLTSEHLTCHRDRVRILDWAIRSSGVDSALRAGQESGTLPNDEYFDPTFAIFANGRGRLRFDDPRQDLLVRLRGHLANRAGPPASGALSQWVWQDSSSSVIRALAMLQIRSSSHHCPVQTFVSFVRCSGFHLWHGADQVMAQTLALAKLSDAENLLPSKSLSAAKLTRFLAFHRLTLEFSLPKMPGAVLPSEHSITPMAVGHH